MAARAQSEGAPRGARPAADPHARAGVSFGEPGGTDELSIILVPTATLDAALALGRRLGDLPPAAVINLALKRLQEDADRRGI